MFEGVKPFVDAALCPEALGTSTTGSVRTCMPRKIANLMALFSSLAGFCGEPVPLSSEFRWAALESPTHADGVHVGVSGLVSDILNTVHTSLLCRTVSAQTLTW